MRVFIEKVHPAIAFLSFLFLYGFIAIYFGDKGLIDDENRYMFFAQNLLHGCFSPPNELDLWCGPGYPIILMPFVYFDLPVVSIRLLNALFHYGSVLLVFYSIKKVTNLKTARITSLIWALYFIAYQHIPFVFTEPVTVFLISLISFFVIKSFDENKLKDKLLSGFFLGFLALTKVIFAYVILVAFVFYFLLLIIRIKKDGKRFLTNEILIFSIALLTILPYLIYTFGLTGRVFYLANSGGTTLYSMSTPYEGEFGDWNTREFDANCGDKFQPCNAHYFLENHKEAYEYIYDVEGVERDDRFKEVAIRNIKEHPQKYIRNMFANQGRLWFGFPFSHLFQKDKTLIRMFTNSILFSAFIYMLIFWVRNFRKIPSALNLLFLILMVYYGGSSLLSAYSRQLYVIVPMMLLLISYSFQKSIQINFSLKLAK